MTLHLGAIELTPGDVEAVARCELDVDVTEQVWSRLRNDKLAVSRAVASGEEVYGVTRGLGARSQATLTSDEQVGAGLRVVRARAVGTGAPLPTPLVRAAVLARASSLARGGSGAAPAVLALLVAMLNRRVHPVVPEVGSIGSSDLVQMAHIALVLAGEGEAEVDGVRRPGGEALRLRDLEPVALDARDALALCSASPLAAGTAALCVSRLKVLAESASLVGALSFEGWRAGTGVLSDAVLAMRVQPGQRRAAGRIREHLRGGDLLTSASGRRLQDPISFRCIASTHGALLVAVDALADALTGELNGNGDNPVVVDGRVVPTGNFHTPLLALACDQTALAVAQQAAMGVARLQRFLEPHLSGLPENLTRHGPSRAGFAPTVKTAQALMTRLRHGAAPTSLDPRMGATSVEDHSTNAAFGAMRLLDLLDSWRHILALEALVAAQACDIRIRTEAPTLGRDTAELHTRIRSVVPPLDDDRPLGRDIDAVAEMFATSAPVVRS